MAEGHLWQAMEHDVELPARDGDGYLADMSEWTPEIGQEMAKTDGVDMTDEKWEQVLAAREYYAEKQTVPPVRKFAQAIGSNTETLYALWQGGPMKIITKYGGLPKPTGCV